MSLPLIIGLSAVIVAADTARAEVLVTARTDGLAGLPFGAFDPDRHRTFELGLRGWVREQTGFELGYVEQLYTFGDRGRETPDAHLSSAPGEARVISVSYLALTPETGDIDTSFNANWRSWYRFFPWEDRREERATQIVEEMIAQLKSWASGRSDRLDRARLAFGSDGQAWIEERVLERYELLYEAGLVAECARDGGLPSQRAQFGEAMASDHRRILATAISRLRGKLKYRPVVFELMPERFTLSALQQTCEALLGLTLHKQNFRRALDRAGLVEGTGAMETSTGGRPAELFRFRREILRRRIVSGVATPARRTD